jgi:hypothetical protein
MRRVKMMTAAAVLTVLTALSGSAVAQETNVSERTFLTFSSAFELPGLTLQPGTYVFKLADTGSRNVVQVFSRDEKEILGQWLFVQASRPDVTDENVVMFKETPAGTLPAVQYWYFPGEKIGKEFIYPKDQATRLARATGVPILTAENDTPVRYTPPPASVVAAEPAAIQRAEPRPLPEPVATTGVVEEAQVARAETLPATASPLALSGLLGLLALAGAAGLRALRRT